MIEIREEKLHELLTSRNKFIGPSEIPYDGWFADAALLLSVIATDYKPLLGIPVSFIKGFFYVILAAYTGFLILRTIKAKKDAYTFQNLYDDILNSSERPHAFCLIVVRSTFESCSNRYLLLYDERWKCFLFPYIKSGASPEACQRRIKEYLSSHLGVPADSINPVFRFEKEHEKYSVSDKVNKLYHHSFYEVDLADYVLANSSSRIKSRYFEMNGYGYEWMTVAEMHQSKNIMDKNGETVDDISDYYGV